MPRGDGRRLGTLVVVGTGAEPPAAPLCDSARRVVIEADKVLFLTGDRDVERWVRSAAREPESLAVFHLPGLSPGEVWRDMAEWVLTYVRLGWHVAVLVTAEPAAAHVITALVRDEGYPAVMVPAADADAWLHHRSDNV
jgi:hypothetical protein